MIDPILLVLLIVIVLATVSVFVFQDLLYVIIIFGVYSGIMALIWQRLNAPDIAITEAAVGIASTVLMVAVVSRVGRRPR
jgi:energy-converting hydrogenase B subunit D